MARMVDDMVASAASKSDYIQWVVKDKLGFDDKSNKKYFNMIMALSNIEFVWIHPMDENRAIDGLDLRKKFTYETGLYLDGASGLTAKCSVFEMMAALAIRIENQIMRNLSIGDRTGKWFLEMCKNLRIDENSKVPIIESAVNRMLYRDYKSNGDGGLFPLKSRSNDKNQKNEQIWSQCMAYLNENYPNDDPGLALYS